MSKFRLSALLCAIVMVIAGALYLAAGESTLPFVLPSLSISLWGITVFQYLDIRTAGGRGIITLLPAIAMGLAAIVTTLATLSFFAGM